MKKKRLLIYFCISLALFTLLGVSFFYLSKLNALEKYNNRVDNSYQVILQTNLLEQNLSNAETGQRGFLLTSDPVFLENYLKELKTLPSIFLKLDYLTSDNYAQQKNLDTLKRIINIQLKFLKNNLEHKVDDSLTLNHFHESNISMNQVKHIIENIKQNESYLLAERTISQTRNTTESKKSSFVSLLISFGLCCIASIAIIAFYNQSETHRFNLEDKVQQLNVLNREVKELTLASTHNLQEPMRKVQLLIDRIQYIKDPESEHLQEQIERIKQIYNQQQKVNDTIVDYYDILADNGNREPTDINELLSQLIKKNNWQNLFQLNVEKLKTVMANPHQLKLLFTHVIANSIRFRHPNQSLCISITGKNYDLKKTDSKILYHKHYYIITISDNGSGLEEQYHEKIFHLFQKIEPDQKTDQSHSGMGLSFCNRIMLNHNGWINAQSHSPRGLSISLYFPNNM